MRNVTHDHTNPATTESVCLLAEALTCEIARLVMTSNGGLRGNFGQTAAR
jgi:hypothetical protein